jgi:hypothetical protein
VQILNTIDYLISYESKMGIFQYLLTDSIMQIGLHEFEDQIQIFIVVRLEHIVKLYYIGVV